MKDKIIEILKMQEEESACGMYDFIHRKDYGKVAEEIIAVIDREL